MTTIEQLQTLKDCFATSPDWAKEKINPYFSCIELELKELDNLLSMDFKARQEFENEFNDWLNTLPNVEMNPANVLCYLQIKIKENLRDGFEKEKHKE